VSKESKLEYPYVESVHQFGEEQRLVGIVTRPNELKTNNAVILLNSGLLSKSGAFRFSVELARELASQGQLVFRFDFGGIGDSETGLTSETFIERSNMEITLAMQLLASQYEIETFTVGGLCSAADCALQLASVEKRVSGLLLIDPPAYKTKSYYRWHQINRVLRTLYSCDIRRWFKLFQKIAPNKSTDSSVSLNFRIFPNQDKLNSDLKQFVVEGRELFFAYTGGSSTWFNHKQQFFEMFTNIDFGEQLSLHYLPRSDHMGILKRDRENLISRIVRWRKRRFVDEKAR
jgi:pimeloyl-ACP methyl ester carboxylesterase